jgi:hypothetical protein
MVSNSVRGGWGVNYTLNKDWLIFNGLQFYQGWGGGGQLPVHSGQKLTNIWLFYILLGEEEVRVSNTLWTKTDWFLMVSKSVFFVFYWGGGGVGGVKHVSCTLGKDWPMSNGLKFSQVWVGCQLHFEQIPYGVNLKVTLSFTDSSFSDNNTLPVIVCDAVDFVVYIYCKGDSI